MDCGLWVHSSSHLLFVKGKQMYCLLLCKVESLVQQLPRNSEIKTSAYGKNGMRSQFLWLRWSCFEIYPAGLLSSRVSWRWPAALSREAAASWIPRAVGDVWVRGTFGVWLCLPALSEGEYLKGESLVLSLPASLQPLYSDENHASEIGCDYINYIVLWLGLLNSHL